jgi:membrane protein DedA with SNARE-associated domain
MWEEIAKAIPVALGSALKFILGPIAGVAARLHILTTIIATVVGMMASVTAFTYFGEWIRTHVLDRFFKKRKKRSTHPKLQELWKKFGLAGIAALTPLILTPIGGTLLAVSSGSPRKKIIVYMAISAVAWAIIFSAVLYLFGRKVLPEWVK